MLEIKFPLEYARDIEYYSEYQNDRERKFLQSIASFELVQIAVEKANVKHEQFGTILVVDDDPIILDEIEGFFTRKGFKCKTASDAFVALKVFHSNLDITVIVTDVNMPLWSGEDLIEAIKDTKTEDRILKCFYMSGENHSNFEKDFLDKEQCIAKPLDLLKLAKLVELSEVARFV
jgi:CheY-like chemotaxis protein